MLLFQLSHYTALKTGAVVISKVCWLYYFLSPSTVARMRLPFLDIYLSDSHFIANNLADIKKFVSYNPADFQIA